MKMLIAVRLILLLIVPFVNAKFLHANKPRIAALTSHEKYDSSNYLLIPAFEEVGLKYEVVQAMIFAAEQFDAEELLYKTKAKKISLTSDLTADLISRDALLTSDMISYAYNAARSGKLPQDVLGSHNQKQQNYRSPKGFLLGWSADEALAAAVYLFVRYSDNPQQAIIDGVNTPGDSDSIASLAGALIEAKTGTIFHDLDTIQLENRNHLIMLCSLIP
jgi:ADP-ribosylglycohydrolase